MIVRALRTGGGALRLLSVVALLFLYGLTIAPDVQAQESDCGPELSEATIAAELEKGYEAFDQTQGQGWRQWTSGRCYAYERLLLERYLEHRKDLSSGQQNNVRFHLGQVIAYQGDREAALRQFKKCFGGEARSGEFNWNAYLRGTIAFLERDQPALSKAQAELEAGQAHIGNRVNLRVLRSFFRYWDSGYAVAYEASVEQSN